MIDVEREALLLVCVALQSLAATYSVLAFSGKGQGVVVRTLKDTTESYGPAVQARMRASNPNTTRVARRFATRPRA